MSGARSPRRGAWLAAGIVFVAATAILWIVSRGKWSDAIVDTGTEWVYADALARGRLLYRDVIYWFGPFTPYWQAAFLRVFGSGFPALVGAGAVGATATLVGLHLVLRRVAGRLEATLWTALAVPALVFMPNAGGAILGMGYRIWHPATFALFALAVACRPGLRLRTGRAAAAGLFCGLAALSRTEWGLMALAGVLAALFAGRRPRWIRDAVVAVFAATLLFAAVLAAFVAVAGREAVLGDGHILLTGISPETREFLVRFSGLPDWKRGIAQTVYSAAMWLGAGLVLERLAFVGRRPRPRRALAFGATVAVLLGAALAQGASGAVLFSAAPVASAAAIPAGWRRRGRPRAAALCGAGVVGLLASHRRPFHIGDSAYVAPPLLFAIVAVAGLLHLRVAAERRAESRRRLRAAFAFGAAVLVVVAFAGRILQYAADPRVTVPGTGGMVRAMPRTEREIVATALAVRRTTRAADRLVVFPEGQIVNALSGRENALRQKLYIPGYLTDANEGAVLADLAASPPRAIVVWPRGTSEYGRGGFGADYGLAIRRWIEANYDELPPPLPRSRVRLYRLREPPEKDRARIIAPP